VTDRSRALMASSLERAAAVGHWLIGKGIGAARLEAIGCGVTRPLTAEHGAQRAKNDRVELYVTDPLPPSGMRSSLGCEVAELVPPAPVAPPPPPAKPAEPPMPAPAPVAAPAPTPAPAPKPAAPAAVPAPAATGLSSGSLLSASTTAAAVAAALAADPHGDRDKDGVANGNDQCPLAPGKAGAHGCPEYHRVDLDAGQIELLKPVRFHDGESQVHSQSLTYVDEVAATLRANPEMKLLIEVHVPGEGSAEQSLALTRKRAAVVRDRLVAQGVAPARLRAYGCGESRPIAPNNVPWGRKKNDRVELHLLDPASPSSVHSLEGCSTSE
jgi:outer membrane protein OmpA-like peptidoglycan-associated protein